MGLALSNQRKLWYTSFVYQRYKGKEADGLAKGQMDLTEGVIWKKLIIYALPVVLSSLLQSAYSITDLIVAGWFIGKDGISAINNAGQVMVILT